MKKPFTAGGGISSPVTGRVSRIDGTKSQMNSCRISSNFFSSAGSSRFSRPLDPHREELISYLLRTFTALILSVTVFFLLGLNTDSQQGWSRPSEVPSSCEDDVDCPLKFFCTSSSSVAVTSSAHADEKRWCACDSLRGFGGNGCNEFTSNHYALPSILLILVFSIIGCLVCSVVLCQYSKSCVGKRLAMRQKLSAQLLVGNVARTLVSVVLLTSSFSEGTAIMLLHWRFSVIFGLLGSYLVFWTGALLKVISFWEKTVIKFGPLLHRQQQSVIISKLARLVSKKPVVIFYHLGFTCVCLYTQFAGGLLQLVFPNGDGVSQHVLLALFLSLGLIMLVIPSLLHVCVLRASLRHPTLHPVIIQHIDWGGSELKFLLLSSPPSLRTSSTPVTHRVAETSDASSVAAGTVLRQKEYTSILAAAIKKEIRCATTLVCCLCLAMLSIIAMLLLGYLKGTSQRWSNIWHCLIWGQWGLAELYVALYAKGGWCVRGALQPGTTKVVPGGPNNSSRKAKTCTPPLLKRDGDSSYLPPGEIICGLRAAGLQSSALSQSGPTVLTAAESKDSYDDILGDKETLRLGLVGKKSTARTSSSDLEKTEVKQEDGALQTAKKTTMHGDRIKERNDLRISAAAMIAADAAAAAASEDGGNCTDFDFHALAGSKFYHHRLLTPVSSDRLSMKKYVMTSEEQSAYHQNHEAEQDGGGGKKRSDDTNADDQSFSSSWISQSHNRILFPSGLFIPGSLSSSYQQQTQS